MTVTEAQRAAGPHNHWRCGGCDGSKPMTLADKELITGRVLTQFDDETGIPFCVDCLADLPVSAYEQLFHVCGEDPRPAPEPAAAVVVHKTRTTQPAGYNEDGSGCRRFDKRGRVMFDRGSWALCSCGWVGAGATREEARSAARSHRAEAEAGR